MDRAERFSLIFVLALAASLVAAAALLVAEFGVDVFFYDHWLVYEPFFNGDGALQAFTRLHNQTRIGLGAPVMSICAQLSDWDARADSVAVILILCASTLVAIAIKRRLFGRIDATDLVIPAIVLNLVQIEAVVLVPLPFAASLPVLLLLLVCMFSLSTSPITRAVALSVLSPLLVFTGFGLVAAPVLFVLFALEAANVARSEGFRSARLQLAPLVMLAAAALLFLAGYEPNLSQPAPFPDVVRFAALMPAKFGSIESERFGDAAAIAGLVILSVLVFVAMKSLGLVARSSSDARSRTIFLLSAYTLSFIALASVGRAFQGAQFGQSSRYMPMLVPGMLALHFASRAAEGKISKVLLTALVVVLSLGAILPPSLQHDQSTQVFSLARREWRDCYLATHDAQRCAERARMQVWVGPYDEKFQAQLDYLERNRLSLFRPQD